MRKRWQSIEKLGRQLNVTEDLAGLPLTRPPDPTFLAVAFAWAAGEGFAEAIMRPSGDQTGAALVLFADGSKPTPGEAVLVFETDHVPAFSERILANGGVVTHPAQTLTRWD